MEFHERLQELRKRKGLTQEEVAQALFVSRTAVSKWESGRGYPHIDSLKALASFFEITIDELLSGKEALHIAEEDQKQQKSHFCDRFFGLLDLSAVLLIFLPLFGQKTDQTIVSVSLMHLTQISGWLRTLYWILVIGMVSMGILLLSMQNCRYPLWVRCKRQCSLAIHIVTELLFIISSKPYAAALLFLFLVLKGLTYIKPACAGGTLTCLFRNKQP